MSEGGTEGGKEGGKEGGVSEHVERMARAASTRGRVLVPEGGREGRTVRVPTSK